MKRLVSTFTLGLLLATTACGDDSSTGDSDGNATTEAATTEAGATEAATTESATTEATTDAATTDVATTDPGDETANDTEAAGACDPEASDDECATCVKESCCPQLEACDADESGECQCFQACVETMPGVAGVEACTTECDAAENELITMLVMCSAGCAAQCI
ncbi:MAG: hypothetical protein AAF799_31530 [Myxococcota bacterium]